MNLEAQGSFPAFSPALPLSLSLPPSLQEIVPFVWEHWDIICTKRSKAGNWRNNLSTKLVRGWDWWGVRDEGGTGGE